jgi:hypothetical protein
VRARKDTRLSADELQRQEEMARKKGHELDPDELRRTTPLVRFGSFEVAKLEGSRYRNSIVSSSIKRIGTDAYEQLITSGIESDSSTGKVTREIRETSFRMKFEGTDRVSISVQQSTYSHDHSKLYSQDSYEGSFTRDWNSSAKEISQRLNNRSWDKIVREYGI